MNGATYGTGLVTPLATLFLPRNVPRKSLALRQMKQTSEVKFRPTLNGTNKETHGGIVDTDGAKIQTPSCAPQRIWGMWVAARLSTSPVLQKVMQVDQAPSEAGKVPLIGTGLDSPR